MWLYDLKEEIQYRIVSICLWLIKQTNPSKNRCLAARLYEVAKLYDPE